jgi:hypothetical protein
VARRQQGVAGDLEGVTGKVPGKEERARALVGGDGGCRVLHHRCERWKLRLARIWEWCSSEGAHRRGRRRRRRSVKSDVRVRPPVAGGGATGAEMVGREAALERGAGAGSVSREWTSGRGRALSGSVGGAAERERKERGGPAAKVPHGAGRRRGAWPRPVGGAPTVSRPVVTRLPRARAARQCSDNGTLAPTARAPVAARVGRPSPDEQ